MYLMLPASRSFLPGLAGLGDIAIDLAVAERRLAESRNALETLRKGLTEPRDPKSISNDQALRRAWRAAWAQKLGISVSRTERLLPLQTTINSKVAVRTAPWPEQLALDAALANKRAEIPRLEADVRGLEQDVARLKEAQRVAVVQQALQVPIPQAVAITHAASSPTPALPAPQPQQLPAPAAPPLSVAETIRKLQSAGDPHLSYQQPAPIPIVGPGDLPMPAVPKRSNVPLLVGGGAAALAALYLFS